jgi:hypothetical protein
MKVEATVRYLGKAENTFLILYKELIVYTAWVMGSIKVCEETETCILIFSPQSEHLPSRRGEPS